MMLLRGVQSLQAPVMIPEPIVLRTIHFAILDWIFGFRCSPDYYKRNLRSCQSAGEHRFRIHDARMTLI